MLSPSPLELLQQLVVGVDSPGIETEVAADELLRKTLCVVQIRGNSLNRHRQEEERAPIYQEKSLGEVQRIPSVGLSLL